MDQLSGRSSAVDKSRILERGLKQIERESKSLAEFCGRLIRFPTENPPAMMTDITEFIRDWLKDYGVSSRIHSKEKGKEHLVSNLGRRAEAGLVFYGHADVVPAGNRKRWSFPPYSGKTTADGKILGRGASDMKGGLAALLFAFKVLGQLDIKLRKNLQLITVPDEENFDPARKLLYKLIDAGVVAGEGCIMGEPTGLGAIGVGDRGDLWLRLKAAGRPAHGSSPVLGDSAILRLNGALAALTAIWNDEPPIPAEVKEVLPFSRELVEQYATMMGATGRLEEAKKLLTHTSVNIGTIRGGTMINMVPDSAEADIALCLAPSVTAAKAMERTKELLAETTGVEIEKLLESDPNFTSPKLEFINILGKASHSVMGSDPRPFLSTGTSDAHAFRLRGIPTVWFGPGNMTVIHGYDENVDAKELTEFAKTYFRTAVEFCV
jgi:succinyl-diaminopimelate desuccinylase